MAVGSIVVARSSDSRFRKAALNHCPSKKIAAGACSVAQTHPNSIVTSACVVCYAWPLSTSVTTGVAVPLMKGQA